MNDRPTAAELIDAVRQYLEKELLPTLTDPRQRFQTLVAANVLSVAERELKSEESMSQQEHRLLQGMLGKAEALPPGREEGQELMRKWNAEWCAAIRAGAWDERWGEALRVAREQVRAKLSVANPRYLGTGKG